MRTIIVQTHRIKKKGNSENPGKRRAIVCPFLNPKTVGKEGGGGGNLTPPPHIPEVFGKVDLLERR